LKFIRKLVCIASPLFSRIFNTKRYHQNHAIFGECFSHISVANNPYRFPPSSLWPWCFHGSIDQPGFPDQQCWVY
jgi:hypothetical protein